MEEVVRSGDTGQPSPTAAEVAGVCAQRPHSKAKGSSPIAGKRKVCWQCLTLPVYRRAGHAKEER